MRTAESKHVERFSGVVKVDAYPGYKILEKLDRPAGPIRLAFRETCLRRRFCEFRKSTGSPMAYPKDSLKRMASGQDKAIRSIKSCHAFGDEPG